MDWFFYPDRSRFEIVPTERAFALQGTMSGSSDEGVLGSTTDTTDEDRHVFVETSGTSPVPVSRPNASIV